MIIRAVLAAVLALAMFATPPGGHAQQAGKVHRLGVLLVGEPELAERLRQLYSKRLSELGWQEGRNLSIDFRQTIAADRTGELATSLVAAKPDVVIAIGAYPAHSLRNATQTIPIVLAAVADPVGRGLVASLARPGGNITGVSHLTDTGFSLKELQILMELLPRAERFAFLRNPANPLWKTVSPLPERLDVSNRKITLEIVDARTVDDVPAAIEAAARLGIKGLIVSADPVFATAQKRIVEIVAKHNLPAIYPDRTYVAAGGLVAYGTDLSSVFRRSADYVDKILRGTKPADLPIERPTKFELVINLKIAKVLDLTIPQSVLVRADHLIE